MVVLKRIKSSTLMETLVATVLIVVIFMVSSMLMNSMFTNSIKRNDTEISERFHELEYQYRNGAITLPFYEEGDAYEISAISERSNNKAFLVLKAKRNSNSKTFEKLIFDDK